MIYKTPRATLVTLLVISLILLFIVAFAIYDIRKKNMETSVLLNEVQQVSDARSLAQAIRAVQNNAAEDLKNFDDLLLSSGKLVFLIESIEKTGRALKLKTDIVSVGKPEDTEASKSNKISIAIETQGAWVPTLSFLRAIESLPYRVMIEESNLSKTDTNWQSKIVLTLYSFD